MKYFKKDLDKSLDDKIPGARLITPDLDQKAIDMLKRYIDQILENDHSRNRIDQDDEVVH